MDRLQRVSSNVGHTVKERIMDKKHEVVLFSSTAIALYGYDQGMMSLINTNHDYLSTMGLSGESPMVGVIVSVYYLGCAVGAVLASLLADKRGRKPSIFTCLAVTALGNLIMFISGLGFRSGAMALMLVGRTVMGLGVGGIDAVIPVYSSELAPDSGRGKALAQEFQMNIFGLLMAFAVNLLATNTLGKSNQWAWRVPIIVMQIYPVLLLAVMGRLPETPRWFIFHERRDDAHNSLQEIYGKDEAQSKLDELQSAHEEESSKQIGYMDMLLPNRGRSQFHPTVLTIMGQVNQALTGYGAVSVYGPQIFQLLGFGVNNAEYLTLGNYLFYFLTMTFAWLYIDAIGRRPLMVWGAFGLSFSFGVLTVLGGLAFNSSQLGIPNLAVSIPGSVVLYMATSTFGIGWLATVWLIPTEIYPSTARAQGSAISVIIWGLANFAVTLLTPIGFNNLNYWLFLVFCVTNLFAGLWTWAYSPETGGRSFEENVEFFERAEKESTWRVSRVGGGEYSYMPKKGSSEEDGETAPLLRRRS
ncbi:MAG: hypothetical protein M1812_000699 [Candelaria pacifica]|nr:MAG: hypothetical protein M1812_000699 [Candelaria pacifica]